jgi:hypothetical protein
MPTHVERLPQEEPQGALEVSTLGITKGERGDRVVHVRMTVSNEGDATPWTLDTREQLIDVPGAGRSQPLFANASVETLPMLTIGRRGKRVVDLYFPLPPNVTEAEDLPGFDLLWQINTARRTVSGRTHVDRREVVEQPQAVYTSRWEPYWWYDPWYPRVSYRPIYVHRHVHPRLHHRRR